MKFIGIKVAFEINCYTVISDDNAVNATYDITSSANLDINYLIINLFKHNKYVIFL